MLDKPKRHCCKEMDYQVHSHYLLKYSPHTKKYDFILYNHPDGNHLPLFCCPWCGKKLPKTLGKEWCAIIKEKFGLDYVFKQEWAKLPKEFKTEEWWRKRGL